MLVTKLSKLKDAAAANDWLAALRIASKFPQLGEHKAVIMSGWQALQSPAFYREIGKNPDELVAAAVAALKEKYKL